MNISAELIYGGGNSVSATSDSDLSLPGNPEAPYAPKQAENAPIWGAIRSKQTGLKEDVSTECCDWTGLGQFAGDLQARENLSGPPDDIIVRQNIIWRQRVEGGTKQDIEMMRTI